MTTKNVIAIASFLAQTRFLGVLTLDELLNLAAETESYSCAEGHTIFREGDPPDRLYIIRTGSARVVRHDSTGNELLLAVLYHGDLLGELAIIDGRNRSASALATEPVEAITITQARFLAFLSTRPDACLRVMRLLAARLRRTDDLLEEAVFAEPELARQPGLH